MKESAEKNQFPSRGLPLANGRASMGPMGSRRQAPAPITMAATTNRGTTMLKEASIPAAPVRATASTSRVIAAFPAMAGRPKTCSRRAPAPAIMATITSKRKKRKTPLTIPRSQGSSQGTMMRSNSVLPVRLAMSITRRLKRQKAAMASTMPARPYPPKTPKNWSSS